MEGKCDGRATKALVNSCVGSNSRLITSPTDPALPPFGHNCSRPSSSPSQNSVTSRARKAFDASQVLAESVLLLLVGRPSS